MIPIPPHIQRSFQERLQHHAIPSSAQAASLKWLRYYLDVCQKYHFPPEQRASLRHFLKKLREKRQSPAQQEHAAHAIAMYYNLLRSASPAQPLQQETSLARSSPEEGRSPISHVVPLDLAENGLTATAASAPSHHPVSRGVVRAKRRPYIPVVLSRTEIEAILQHLEPPYDLDDVIVLREPLLLRNRREHNPQIPQIPQISEIHQNRPLIGLIGADFSNRLDQDNQWSISENRSGMSMASFR